MDQLAGIAHLPVCDLVQDDRFESDSERRRAAAKEPQEVRCGPVLLVQESLTEHALLPLGAGRVSGPKS
jgi:hypothetical protein